MNAMHELIQTEIADEIKREAMHGLPATVKQKRYLVAIGYEYELVHRMSKKDAQFIIQEIAERENWLSYKLDDDDGCLP